MTTPVLSSFPAAVHYVQSLSGASQEDAERIVKTVGAFAIAQHMEAEASVPKPPPAPQGVTMNEVKAYVDGRLSGLSEQILRDASDAMATMIDAAREGDWQ